MAINPYHSSHPNNSQDRHKRHVAEEQQELLPLLEVQRALDYFSKYDQPIPLDSDTIYAEENSNSTGHQTQKVFGNTSSRYHLPFQRR